MKVSIITATYNSAATVADTLHSIQKQTYPAIEHIIIDGLSNDNTLQIVSGFNHVQQVVSEKDTGIYDAMNKGITYATGDIIGILNSDDFYPAENIIEEVVKIFNTTNCDALYGDLVFVDAIETNKIYRRWIAGTYSDQLFLKGWMPPHPTFFVRKEIYNQYGKFNTTLKSSADYELMVRLLYLHKIKVGYLHGTLVHMRIGGQSTKSLSNRLKANYEDYQAWRLNSLKPKWYTLLLKPIRKIKQFYFPKF
jgi:glycosyltransferase